MKLFRQIAALTALALAFLALDGMIWFNFTRRYVNDASPQMQAKSVEVDRCLPFDDASAIVKLDSQTKLSGDLPVVDGAAALFPVFSAFVNAVYPEGSVTYADGDFAPDSALQYTNTRGAYKAVVDGGADIVFCAGPSEEQKAYAESRGVALEYVPIGREAFVFLVNVDNPVNGLTTTQVQDMYAGKITDWAEVGGDRAPVDAVQRNPGSGSQTAMLAFMNGVPMRRNPLALAGRSIGFSFRYYVEGIVENGGVKLLALNGVYPDRQSIADGSYPIIADFYEVFRRDDANPIVRRLIDWILSEEGQYIIAESGYVPLK